MKAVQILTFTAVASLLAVGVMAAASMDREDASPVERVRTSPAIGQCINLGNTLEAPNEGEWGPAITQADLDNIRRLGFDTVRLPVAWSEHLGPAPDYRIDPVFFARVDEVIGWALARDLQVILDVHHFRALDEDADANIPVLMKIWEQLAPHYADWPERLIFEPINEPNRDFTVEKVNRFNADILKLIRRTNPDRWVILGGGNWGNLEPFREGADPAFAPVSDPRSIATFHYYEPFDFTHQDVSFMDDAPPPGRAYRPVRDGRMIRSDMQEAARWQARHNISLFVGEFGVYRHVPLKDRVAWTAKVRKEMDAAGLTWCMWDYQAEFRLVDPDTARPLPGMMAALFDEN